MKVCPFCAEQIKEEAIKCRFCGEMLTPVNAIEARVQADPIYQKAETVKYAAKAFSDLTSAAGCLMILGTPLLLLCLGVLNTEGGRIVAVCVAIGLLPVGLMKLASGTPASASNEGEGQTSVTTNSPRLPLPANDTGPPANSAYPVPSTANLLESHVDRTTNPPVKPASSIPLAIGLLSFPVFFCVVAFMNISSRSQDFKVEAESLLSTYDKVVFFFEPKSGGDGFRSYRATAAQPTKVFIMRYQGTSEAEPRTLFVKKLAATADALEQAKTEKEIANCKQRIKALRDELKKL